MSQSTKFEYRNSKQIPALTKVYNLEDRTFKFAKDIRTFISNLNRSVSNVEDIRQLVRSSGSIGANYIEANESLGKKDFLMKIRICRKEAKESIYWLKFHVIIVFKLFFTDISFN